MALRCPLLLPVVIVSDEPRLAATLSCYLAQEGTYLPIIDGPRMQRPDHRAELVRRNNGIARVDPDAVFLAGVEAEGLAALKTKLPRRLQFEFPDIASLKSAERGRVISRPPLLWGNDQIGIGLLKALRAGTSIEFEERPSTVEDVSPLAGHMVICEAGEELSEVMAANYAFALGAGLRIIPQIAVAEANALMQRLYALYESGDPQAAFMAVRSELRSLCGDLDLAEGSSLTFFTRRLPLGAGFPELPSTHLFTYPDLGLALISGFSAEQPRTPGVNVAVLIDPQTTEASEIDAAAKELAQRRTFVRIHKGGGTEVTDVSRMVDLYPYDLLIFATHCGDASGYRWTYNFVDKEGLQRTLVVDIALGIGQTEDSDVLEVIKMMHFHSLDSVDWNGPDKEGLYVGTAISDFLELERAEAITPVKRESIPRVLNSAVMRMHDNNYLPMPQSLAGGQTPIIINNACVSWHELASRFMFAGARAYVGTLVDVNSMVAQEFVPLLVGKYYGTPLAQAVWAAQHDIYGDLERQPYVATGVYPQFLRATRQDTPAIVKEKLDRALAGWRKITDEYEQQGDPEAAKRTQRHVAFYEEEVEKFGTITRVLEG